VSAVLIAAIVAAVIHNIRKGEKKRRKRAGGGLICKIGTFYLLFRIENIIMPGKGRKVSWHYYKATTDCKHWDDNFELIKWQL